LFIEGDRTKNMKEPTLENYNSVPYHVSEVIEVPGLGNALVTLLCEHDQEGMEFPSCHIEQAEGDTATYITAHFSVNSRFKEEGDGRKLVELEDNLKGKHSYCRAVYAFRHETYDEDNDKTYVYEYWRDVLFSRLESVDSFRSKIEEEEFELLFSEDEIVRQYEFTLAVFEYLKDHPGRLKPLLLEFLAKRVDYHKNIFLREQECLDWARLNYPDSEKVKCQASRGRSL
jgi:hypothetical protein